MAQAESADALLAVLKTAGITGFTRETLEQAFENLKMSRNSLALTDLFGDHSYYSCTRKLSAMGIETNPAEFDLIRDILDAAHDDSMGPEMDTAMSPRSGSRGPQGLRPLPHRCGLHLYHASVYRPPGPGRHLH